MHIFSSQIGQSADVVIQIPWDVGLQDGSYRLTYSPPQGKPPSNTTFRPQDIAKGIELTDALPGTEYSFSLHYSNASIVDWLAWTASITTVPEPPSNLSIAVRTGRIALVSWDPPSLGGFSAFKLKVSSFSREKCETDRVSSFVICVIFVVVFI
jgi:cadherin 5 type 2 (VE-cadherin)